MEKLVNEPVASNIKDIAREKGMILRRISEKAGFNGQQLSDCFAGRRKMAPCEVLNVARALGVDPGELFAQRGGSDG